MQRNAALRRVARASVSVAAALLAGIAHAADLAPQEYGLDSATTLPDFAVPADVAPLAATIDLRQQGDDNRATVLQQAVASSAWISQVGNGNRADISQQGNGHTAAIVQEGNANAFSLTQSGTGQHLDVTQWGDGLSAQAVQR